MELEPQNSRSPELIICDSSHAGPHGTGRLAEAEQELGTLVADARKAWGPQDMDVLEAEAVAARLRHAQPDGAAAGAAELRAVVERMGEFLGAAHHCTVKWQRVLEGMSADS